MKKIKRACVSNEGFPSLCEECFEVKILNPRFRPHLLEVSKSYTDFADGEKFSSKVTISLTKEEIYLIDERMKKTR